MDLTWDHPDADPSEDLKAFLKEYLSGSEWADWQREITDAVIDQMLYGGRYVISHVPRTAAPRYVWNERPEPFTTTSWQGQRPLAMWVDEAQDLTPTEHRRLYEGRWLDWLCEGLGHGD